MAENMLPSSDAASVPSLLVPVHTSISTGQEFSLLVGPGPGRP